MSAANFEAYLAKLYVDEKVRLAFLRNPYHEAIRAGLSEEEARSLEQIDRTGLEMAAASLARKRERHHHSQR